MWNIDINGTWNFKIDNAGDNINDVVADGIGDAIAVPGVWNVIEKYRTYVGAAWYQRTVDLPPDISGKLVFLRIGGAFRYTDAYVNGVQVGSHIGYQSGMEFDITPCARIGSNTITIRVDNAQRHAIDQMIGCFDYIGMWGGIYENVSLEIREKAYLSDIFIVPDIHHRSACLKLQVTNRTGSALNGVITCRVLDKASGKLAAGVEQAAYLEAGENCLNIVVEMSEMKLWSPEEPNLYAFEVNLSSPAGKLLDSQTVTSGMKSFQVIGKDFYLNGNPYFLRGYGDDIIYPETIMPSATNKEVYTASILKAKAYGFNAARHHSHFPLSAYLDEADRLGLLIQPELAMSNECYRDASPAAEALFKEEWKRLIVKNRNHPCIMAWCGGNEQEWGYPFEDEIYNLAKKLDPTRPATSTDGYYLAKDIRRCNDYASLVYYEYMDTLPVFKDIDLYTRDVSPKPLLVHEMGNYKTLENIHDIEKYAACVIQPDGLIKVKNLVEERGSQEEYEVYRSNSYRMQRLCHKLNIERARLSPEVRGYHVWTITDFHGTCQGILNPFYEPKGIHPEEFIRYNGESVILWDTQEYVFASGECVNMQFRLSKYHPHPFTSARLMVEAAGTKVEIEVGDVDGFGILNLPVVELPLPEVETPQRFTLTARLESPDVTLENNWNLWVYPEIGIESGKPIFIHYTDRHLVEGANCPVNTYVVRKVLDEQNLIVTSVPTQGMIDSVANGCPLLLAAGGDTLRHSVAKNAFKLPWWMAESFFYITGSNNAQASNVVAQHPSLAEIPHEGFWDLNLYRLVHGMVAINLAEAANLDEANLAVTPIIYGINPQLEKLAYLFEFKVGKGKVLVTTMDFSKENMRHLEVRALFHSLVNYCRSERFAPAQAIQKETFEGMFQSILQEAC